MPSKPSTVSIIISTYNQPVLLTKTVESVLNQTYPHIELIVVDDGSTEETAAAMKAFEGRIRYIYQENAGPNAAVSNGFDQSTGDYIGFLDHDDLYLPTKIERQVAVLDAQPGDDVVTCRHYHIDADGNYVDKVGLLPEGEVLKELLIENFIWSGGPLIRRTALEAVGLPPDDTWSGDWHMWLSLSMAGCRFACVQETLGCYRVLGQSMMRHLDKVDQAAMELLDMVYAHPNLPADVTAARDEIYAGKHLWLSCRYFSAGSWEGGQRHLQQAIALNPALADPEALIPVFADDAASVRGGDATVYIEGLLAHLPDSAAALRSQRSRLLGMVYAQQALYSYTRDELETAKTQLAEAVTLDPSLVEQPDRWVASLVHNALRRPIENPSDLVDRVLENLPDNARGLQRIRARALGDISIGVAYEHFAAHQRQSVPRAVVNGVLRHPAWLKNRGVASMFLKSLPDLLPGNTSTAERKN